MIFDMIQSTFKWLPPMKYEERRTIEIQHDSNYRSSYQMYTISIKVYFYHGEVKMCQCNVSRLEVETCDKILDYTLERVCHMMKDEECP